MKRALCLLLLMPVPVLAQQALPGSTNDSRFQTIAYSEGGIFQVRTSPEVAQTLLLGEGERIRSVMLSDPSVYTVTVSPGGDSLSFKANGPIALAIMSVRSDRHSYEIELASGGGAGVAQFIRFSHDSTSGRMPVQQPPTAPPPGVAWRLSGETGLRPATISDDGRKIYIAWHQNQPMPAVFSMSDAKVEQMVDGYVRAGVFTIDRIYGNLIFRIDRKEARAERRVKRESRQHD